jgi:SAM-dependent methyltransferase
MAAEVRSASYGEEHRLSLVDRFGTWLSLRRLRSVLGDVRGTTVADIGCGYDARFGMSLIDEVSGLLLVDISVNPALSGHPRVAAVIGALPDVLGTIPTGSVRNVVMNSVLEHLDEPIETLRELRRVSDPSGVLFVNVPTWLGKRALETSAFRFGLSPSGEIDDHRRYYSKRELWMSLRQAGFKPSEITVRTHKFGLNAYGICRKRR